MELALGDPDLGLWSAPLDAAPGELVIDVLLVADASGASIEGKQITYAGRLRGTVPELHAASGALVGQATFTTAGDTRCAGAISMAMPGDIRTRTDMRGTALFTATLNGNEVVAGTGPECYAIRQDDETIAVECPMAGVRQGDRATDGILRLRVAWSGVPNSIANLPDWAAELLSRAPVPATPAPAVEMTWTVDSNDPQLAANPNGPGGGSVAIRAEDGTIRYRIALPVVQRGGLLAADREGRLYASVSEYDGPGEYRDAAISGSVEVRADGGWDGPNYDFYALVGCQATIASGEGSGALECGIGRTAGAQDGAVNVTGHISVDWQASKVERDVGPAVDIAWQLGGGYVSVGQATVHLPAGSGAAGIYNVPRVRVGGSPAYPEILRIQIAPFTGDATYTGDAVLAMLDNVTGTSANVAAAAAHGWSDLWTPVFGPCSATLRDNGSAGEITCPGGAAPDGFHGASATLHATWQIGG